MFKPCWKLLVIQLILLVSTVHSLDNGNQFRIAWRDVDRNVTAGWTISPRSFDFDKDGKGEFVAYDMVSSERLGFIFEAEGDDSYRLATVMPMGGGALAVTDWNNNNLNELTILDEELLVFECDGEDDGYPFDPTVMWAGLPKKGIFGGNSQGAPALVDIDDDGDLEMICNYAKGAYHIPMYSGYYLSIFSFNGDFANPGGKIEFTDDFHTECCGFSWGDIDKDGKMDIVTSVNQTRHLRVFTCEGKDTFKLKYEWTRPEGALMEMHECYTPMVADMDQDGQVEIYYCDTHGLVYVITGDLSQAITADHFHYLGRFPPVNPSRSLNDVRSTNPGGSLGDQDGDGKLDLYWCDYHAEALFDLEYEAGSILDSASYNWYRIWENTDTVPFGATMLCLGDDMDQDHKKEIVMIKRDTNLDPPAVIVLESIHEFSPVEKEVQIAAASEYRLEQNYPNPFNPNTTIAFSLPHTDQVSVAVYTLRGEKTADLLNAKLAAGRHQVVWNAQDYPSGIYFIVLQTQGLQRICKAMLMK